MERHSEGNILHQDEWSMSTIPHEFPLLSVLLINLLVHGMTSLLIVHVPPFIHSYITLSFQVHIQSRLLHYDLKTQSYHPEAFQDTSRTPRPSRTLKNRDQHLLSKRAHLTLHQSRLTLVVALVSELKVRPQGPKTWLETLLKT